MSVEASQAELEALENVTWSPREKKPKPKVTRKGPPRDELGRFAPKKKAARV